MKLAKSLLVAALAVGFAISSAWAGAGAASQERPASNPAVPIIVYRSPDIGNYQNFHLFIDGNRVATLSYGRKYHGTVAPGLHLVTIKQMPHLNDAWPYSHQWIRILPGEKNVFTATWINGGTRIQLQEG